MNKAQVEKKFYAFHTVFRVDVNAFKPFQNPTGRFPADNFLDWQSLIRLFKVTNRWLIQILPLLILFQQFDSGISLVRRIST